MLLRTTSPEPFRRSARSSTPGDTQLGVTLLEVLVVIAIIGVLVAIMMPAVQAARESARRTQCAQNLRQIGTAVLLHEGVHRHLPSGGWGTRWAGLPDLGFDGRQPGGWIYNTLPFMEQQAVHDLGGSNAAQNEANGERLKAVVFTMHCPSRRRATLYTNRRRWQPFGYPVVASVARNDYAASGGSELFRYGPGPRSLSAARQFGWSDMMHATGVCYQRSRVRLAEISDGASSTYLVGEKHLPLSRYTSGVDRGDNESMCSGDQGDLLRFSGPPDDDHFSPRSDASRPKQEGYVFGSAHPAGLNMLMVDGSVHFLSFTIDQAIHSRLGSRADGSPTQVPE